MVWLSQRGRFSHACLAMKGSWLQPQPLNILNPRQNNIAGQIRKPWKCENRFVQKCFQLLLAGGDGVDVETAAAGNLVYLGDNIAVLKFSAAF